MNELPERFDLFCRDIIAKYRIDIDHTPFEDETDKEVFIIKHLVTVMLALYNGIQLYKAEQANEPELKSIANHHLQQYARQLHRYCSNRQNGE